MSLQFLVDGQPVSHTGLMAFDTKERSFVVATSDSSWNFHFSLDPSQDTTSLRWTASVDIAGRIVHAWNVTGELEDSQTFTATDEATHKKFSVVARAWVLVVPVVKPGGARSTP